MLDELGFAYQLRWRETADASYLPRSSPRCARAALGTDDANAVSGSGRSPSSGTSSVAALASAGARSGSSRLVSAVRRHRRRARRARALRRGVRGVRPDGVAPPEARLVRARRYARELTGDRRGARGDAARARAAAGSPSPRRGRTSSSRSSSSPSEGRRRPPARAGGARALPAIRPHARARPGSRRRRPAGSDRAARRAAEATPTAQAVALLGDLLERAGDAQRPAPARDGAGDRPPARANGVQVDLESAVYRADNRIRPLETVELARRARAAGRRSTATTRSPGRSPARAAATRRSRSRSVRFDSGRRTASSSSTAGTRRDAQAIGPGCCVVRGRWEAMTRFSVRWAPVAGRRSVLNRQRGTYHRPP